MNYFLIFALFLVNSRNMVIALTYCQAGLTGSVGYPLDCSKYVSCSGQSETLMSCGDGTWFNPTYRVCDWPANVPSGVCLAPGTNVVTITTAKATTKATTITSTPAPTNSPAISTTIGSLTSYCNGATGLVGYPPDCTKYISCSVVKTLIPCPSGLYFDPSIQTCNWAVNVPSGICVPPASGSVAPPTNAASTLSTTVPNNGPSSTTTQSNNNYWPGTIMGYYYQTWVTQTNFVPNNYNLVVCFSGWNKISDCKANGCDLNTFSGILGLTSSHKKIMSIGGGNANGAWSFAQIDQLDADVNNGALNGWDGIYYDVEEGDTGLATKLLNSFANTRAKGLKVIFGTSHTQPYHVIDAGVLMNSTLSSNNIDYISPQLYDGVDPGPNNNYDWATTTFNQWAASSSKKLASIWRSTYYQNTQIVLANWNLQGYIQWANPGE